jgi:hypothetical protein
MLKTYALFYFQNDRILLLFDQFRIVSYLVSQDLLAIAAAREFGAYPYDIMSELQSPESSTPSHLASTPRTPNSPIKDICKSTGRISEQCSDHADSLYTLFKSKRNLLESNDQCVAAACVHLAEQANQAGVSCPIEIISSAFQCIESDVLRLSNKLISLYNNEPSIDAEIPVFYACVCDFGLSKVSASRSCFTLCRTEKFCSRPEIRMSLTTMTKDRCLIWRLKFLRRGTSRNLSAFLLLARLLPRLPTVRHQPGCQAHRRRLRLPVLIRSRNRKLKRTRTETFGPLAVFFTNSPHTGGHGTTY